MENMMSMPGAVGPAGVISDVPGAVGPMGGPAGPVGGTAFGVVTPEPTTQEVLARLLMLKAQTEAMKAVYEEIDQLTAMLMAQVGLNNEQQFGGKAVTVIDNFAEKNTVYRPAAVKRFDLDIEDLAERAAKAAKKAAKKK